MNPFPQDSVLGKIWFEHNATWEDAIRRELPSADADFCNYVLWNCTAYPFANQETIFAQIAEFKEAWESLPEGRQLCENCNELAEPGKWMCAGCDFVLTQHID